MTESKPKYHRLHYVLQELNMDRSHFAMLCGISPLTIHRVIHFKSIRRSTAKRICRQLKGKMKIEDFVLYNPMND